jgi:hypothetical protein
MVMDPNGALKPRLTVLVKADCAGKGQQQSTHPDLLTVRTEVQESPLLEADTKQ